MDDEERHFQEGHRAPVLQVIASLKDSLWVFLFAKTLLLTPQPIDIAGTTRLQLAKPISALNSAARIEIDVTTTVGSGLGMEFLLKVDEFFPKGTVSATLHGNGGVSVVLGESGPSGSSDGRSALWLYSKVAIPQQLQFFAVDVRSDRPLKSARVSWTNGSRK